MPGISVMDTYDALLSTTLRNYSRKLRINVINAFPTLKWFTSKNRVQYEDGGYQIVEHLLYGKNTTIKSKTAYGLMDTTPQEGITVALFDWKEIGGTIAISRKERRQNSGKHQLLSLLKAKTDQAELSIKDAVSTQLFADITSEPATDLTSLLLIVSSTPSTTTVGTLSGSTYSWWRNYQADVGSYAASLTDKLRTAFNSCSAGGASFPDALICTQTAFEYYESLGETGKRFINEQKSLDLGFTVLTYKGADMFWDASFASGTPETGESILLINSENARMVIDRDSDFVTTEFIEPENQTASVAKILLMANMTCNNRSKLGILHGIDA